MQIENAPAAAPHPRFVKMPGGGVVDALTGIELARVAVDDLDTETADRVSSILIDALHREFGPRDQAAQPVRWGSEAAR